MIEQKEAWQIRYSYILSLVYAHFLVISCKSIIVANGCTEQSSLLMLNNVIRTVDFLACVYKSIPSTFVAFYIITYVCSGFVYF